MRAAVVVVAMKMMMAIMASIEMMAGIMIDMVMMVVLVMMIMMMMAGTVLEMKLATILGMARKMKLSKNQDILLKRFLLSK